MKKLACKAQLLLSPQINSSINLWICMITLFGLLCEKLDSCITTQKAMSQSLKNICKWNNSERSPYWWVRLCLARTHVSWCPNCNLSEPLERQNHLFVSVCALPTNKDIPQSITFAVFEQTTKNLESQYYFHISMRYWRSSMFMEKSELVLLDLAKKILGLLLIKYGRSRSFFYLSGVWLFRAESRRSILDSCCSCF